MFRVVVVAFAMVVGLAGAQDLKTERVVIVTVEGLRHNEVFGGMDPVLMNKAKRVGVEDEDDLRERFDRPTPKERREALLPFFWNTFSKNGVVLGNPELKSHVKVTNAQRVSFPGYAEILTGVANKEIVGNAAVRNPNETVLEFAQKELGLTYTDVAAFCSWEIFNYICSKEEDVFVVNAGYERLDDKYTTPAMAALNDGQFDLLTPWDSVRFDLVTFTLAHGYIKKYEPKVFYLSLGETDDWAHDNRYDRVLHAANYFDRALEELWNTLQSMDAYRDKTTVIITTDHGRGTNQRTWQSHNSVIPTAIDIWAAVAGPDTPNTGELSDTGTLTQSQIAATAAKFLGLDFNAKHPEAAKPIEQAFE